MKLLFLLLMMFPAFTYAQTTDEKAVETAVENLRKALVDPAETVLSSLTSPALTYGHSNGLVEDKRAFIKSLIAGEFNFDAISLSEQTIKIAGTTAWVRHTFNGDTHNLGKAPGKVTLSVLLVYVKVKGQWLLLARQAVKLA